MVHGPHLLGLQLQTPGLGNCFVLNSQKGTNWVRRSFVVGVVKRAESSVAGRRKSETSSVGDGFDRTLYHVLQTCFADSTSVDGGK